VFRKKDSSGAREREKRDKLERIRKPNTEYDFERVSTSHEDGWMQTKKDENEGKTVGCGLLVLTANGFEVTWKRSKSLQLFRELVMKGGAPAPWSPAGAARQS
jgi:two-component SAPR family response regulator